MFHFLLNNNLATHFEVRELNTAVFQKISDICPVNLGYLFDEKWRRVNNTMFAWSSFTCLYYIYVMG